MAGAEGAEVRHGTGRRGPRKIRIVNDLTPMVDIAFLLVIFFMTTTVFREPQAIEISMPPKGNVPTAQSNVVTIYIDSLGQTTRQLSDEKPVPIVIDSVESYLQRAERANVERQPGGSQYLAQLASLRAGPVRDSLDKFIRRKVSKLVVLIDVHPKSRYQQMVRVMDQVQSANMARFSIIPHAAQTKPTPVRGRGGGR